MSNRVSSLQFQDERTRAYRRMIGFRGTPNELSACVQDCIKLSKVGNTGIFKVSRGVWMCILNSQSDGVI